MNVFREKDEKLRVLYTEAFENHLRAALIRHGDSVIVRIERSFWRAVGAIAIRRVEPRLISSLSAEDAGRDFFIV